MVLLSAFFFVGLFIHLLTHLNVPWFVYMLFVQIHVSLYYPTGPV